MHLQYTFSEENELGQTRAESVDSILVSSTFCAPSFERFMDQLGSVFFQFEAFLRADPVSKSQNNHAQAVPFESFNT